MKFKVLLLLILTLFIVFIAGQKQKISMDISTMKPVKKTLAPKKTTAATTTKKKPDTSCVHEWKIYDDKKNTNEPAIDGFYVGEYYNESKIYIGRGKNQCSGLVYGRLNINATISKPGVYSPCVSTEEQSFDNSDSAMYLVKNQNYFYKWILLEPDEYHDNAIQMKSGNFTYFISKVRVKGIYDNEYYTIGLTIKGFNTFYWDPEIRHVRKLDYHPVQILTCSTTETGEVETEEPRGLCTHTWRSWDPKVSSEDPSLYGVVGGTFINGYPIYLGKGPSVCIGTIFGRVQTNTTQKAGFFHFCEKALVNVGPTSQYLEKKPNNTYFWYPATDYYDETILNSIEMNTGNDDIIFTRTNFVSPSNFTQIGITFTNMTSFAYHPPQKKFMQVPNSMVDILLCTTNGKKEPIRMKKVSKRPSKFCVDEWNPFNSKADSSTPTKDGILVGNYHDDVPFYVGHGRNYWTGITPGRAMVSENYAPGVYTLSKFAEEYDKSNFAEYLINNPNYTYEWVRMEPKSNPYAVSDIDLNGYEFVVARLNITKDDKTFTQMTKTYLDIGSSYWDPFQNKSIDIGMAEVEILICKLKNI